MTRSERVKSVADAISKAYHKYGKRNVDLTPVDPLIELARAAIAASDATLEVDEKAMDAFHDAYTACNKGDEHDVWRCCLTAGTKAALAAMLGVE